MTHRAPSAQDRLLHAALPEFARHGPHGARTQRIAELAGVNKQLIHYYFSDKQGLYHATLSRAAREVAEALSHLPLIGLTAVERLRRLVRGQFDFFGAHEEVTRLLVRPESGGGWAAEAIRPMVELMSEGQATGFFRDDIDPLHHGRVALLLNLGYFAALPLTGSWGDRVLWRDRTADLIVRGCTW